MSLVDISGEGHADVVLVDQTRGSPGEWAQGVQVKLKLSQVDHLSVGNCFLVKYEAMWA